MNSRRSRLLQISGFGLVTVAFAIIQPLVLVGLPLAVLLVTFGPRSAKAAVVVGAIVAITVLGGPTSLWWFERGWPLLLGGTYVWIAGWRPRWNFSAQALAAVGLASAIFAAFLWVTPQIWMELDASMRVRSAQAAQAALGLLGAAVDDTLGGLMAKIAALQVAIFPALVAVSSLGALGLSVCIRNWLVGSEQPQPRIGSLRAFRFNDQLIWVWLGGLGLVLAPLGQVAERVGSNAVFFMGALYVLRGFAVLLALVDGISVAAGVIGGLVALLLAPVLAVLLLGALLLGLGDTWLNVRERARPAKD